MKLYSILFLLVTVILFPACDSTVTDSLSTIDKNTSLTYSGGLNVTLDEGIQDFNKRVRIINQKNDFYLLDLQMNVKTLNNSKREQASIQLDIPFLSENGIFPAGNYNLTNNQIRTAIGNYELIKNNGDFARFNFKGVSATLVIDESNSKYIKGSFIIEMEQIPGIRMTDGQLEDVILSSPTRLQSHFRLEF
ncbi:MAG: hypothetical protein P8X73_04420 [Ignavibacteriaceae bacterium]